MSSWEEIGTQQMQAPKYLARGTKVMVTPKRPEEIIVDGDYGKRTMFTIETEEYGLITVNQQQLIKIFKLFNGDYTSPVTVEL